MAQTAKAGKSRLPISLHIATLPDSQAVLQMPASPQLSRLSSPVLPSSSLRSYKRKLSGSDPPMDSGPSFQVTNARCESTPESHSSLLHSRFDFPTGAEPSHVRKCMKDRPLKQRAVEKGAFFATLPPLPTCTTEVLVRRSLGEAPSDWLRKKISLHRLAVEFNPGARIRLTRKLQPRLRSLLYNTS